MPIYYHIIRAFEILKRMHITSAKLKKHGRSIQKLTSELTKLLPKNMALKNQSTLQNE